jgi:putative transcriptional regulator
MKTVHVQLDPKNPSTYPKARIDVARVDATTDAELLKMQQADDAESKLDAAKFAKRVRTRMGLTQQEFSRRLDVPLNTIRNWEQGKRSPTGAAKALLKLLDRAPEIGLQALS